MTLAAISTRAVSPGERLAFWGDIVWRHVGRLQSDAFGDADFDARLDYGDLADLKLCRIDATRHRVVRTPGLLRGDTPGYLKIVAQLAGSACFEQGGRRAILQPGEWSLYDTAKAYTVTNPQSVRQLVLMLPRERLAGLKLELADLTVRRISGRSGAGRLAFELMSWALEQLWSVEAAHAGRIADLLADRLRHALLETAGIGTDVSLRERGRERVKAYVEANLHDPQLSLDRVATALGWSKRYLHKLFSAETRTLASYIRQARLERIASELAQSRSRARSITEIAFSWGFNSAAHFSRSFHERYGVGAREYRRQHSAAPPEPLH
jgi:AraC-like DNA-binding protein